jgi:hypothetical protein
VVKGKKKPVAHVAKAHSGKAEKLSRGKKGKVEARKLSRAEKRALARAEKRGKKPEAKLTRAQKRALARSGGKPKVEAKLSRAEGARWLGPRRRVKRAS